MSFTGRGATGNTQRFSPSEADRTVTHRRCGSSLFNQMREFCSKHIIGVIIKSIPIMIKEWAGQFLADPSRNSPARSGTLFGGWSFQNCVNDIRRIVLNKLVPGRARGLLESRRIDIVVDFHIGAERLQHFLFAGDSQSAEVLEAVKGAFNDVWLTIEFLVIVILHFPV